MKLKRTSQAFRKLLERSQSPSDSQQACSWQEPPRAAQADELSLMRTSHERRWQIISSYARVLEGSSSSVLPESHLPFHKSLIREAICLELAENPDTETRNHLEIAYAQLETFLPPEELQVLEEFKIASSLAHRMSRSGDPSDIVASARILKLARGEMAVRIQEKISKKMHKRLKQIQAAGMPFFNVSACACSYES